MHCTADRTLISGPILNNPPGGVFANFDEGQQLNLLGNLQLDRDEEPKRGASRANSVRFDESAIQGHWLHGSRSGDLFPLRTGSSLGGHAMAERSASHKSDGRQSSTGHSVQSAHSARTNSLGLDTSFLLGQRASTPSEAVSTAPGMMLLGPVPSIIRCWLDTHFSHDTLLYAAVCTGSFESFLDFQLVQQLGLENQVRTIGGQKDRITMPVYLPEAVVVHPSTLRSASPTPQLPAMTVEFTVMEQPDTGEHKRIEVFIGSDALRSHNADVLFSQNNLLLLTDDHNKVSVPLVRPEDDCIFKQLCISNNFSSDTLMSAVRPYTMAENLSNGMQEQVSNVGKEGEAAKDRAQGSGEQVEVPALAENQPNSSLGSSQSQIMARLHGNKTRSGEAAEDETSGGRQQDSPGSTFTEGSGRYQGGKERRDGSHGKSSEHQSSRESSGGVWGSWRREQGQKAETLGGQAAPGGGHHKPGRSRGTKVLRPSRSSISSTSSPRSFSVSQPSTGFDAAPPRARNHASGPSNGESLPKDSRRSLSGDLKVTTGAKEARPVPTQPRSANPVGGASAFPWLSGAQPRPPAATAD